MVRDFQKSKVYTWEDSRFRLVSKKELTLEQTIELVNDVSRCYGINAPKIVFPDYNSKEAYYSVLDNTLTFTKWSRHRHIVFHELAHCIHHAKGNQGSVHGEMYFSIYAYLLSQYNGYPLYEIFHKAGQMGIKYEKNFPKFLEGMKPNPNFMVAYS